MVGGGMVEGNVVKMGGFDGKEYEGLGLGMGVEGMGMVKYGIDDMGELYRKDVRFIWEFKEG